LPHETIKKKLNILEIFRDAIGKDLARFTVPVWLNEPLSMLEKIAEPMEYSFLFD